MTALGETAAYPFDLVEPVLEMSAEPSRWRRLIAVGAATLALMSTAAGCSWGGDSEPRPAATTGEAGTSPEFDIQHERDLIANGGWDTMPGVSVQGNNLTVQRTGLAVLKMEEGGRPPENPEYEPNPPVNLFGVHVETTQGGAVGFAASLKDIKGAATLSFLNRPTTRFDERVERHEGVDVTIAGNNVAVELFDGSSNVPSTVEYIKLDKPADEATLTVEQHSDKLIVAVNGKRVEIPGKALKQQAWFGLDATDSWGLTNFSAYPLGDNQMTLVHGSAQFDNVKPAPDGLASIAAAAGNKKLFGTAVDPAILMSNPEYTTFLLENFNLFETEMNAKFQALQPEEGVFTFAELDALVAFAEKHDIDIHGHALVFTEAYPKWLADKLHDPATTEDEALALLRTHIQTVVSRYDGKHGHGTIKYWDVVNEPFDPDNWEQINKQNIWYQKLGLRYIEEAFKAAREANPDAELYLNDWAGETDADRLRAMYNLAKDLHDKDLLDGVGLQSHFDEETLDDDEVMDAIYSGNLTAILKQFAAIGVKVRFSEVSVAQNSDNEAQADVNGMIVEACVGAANCTGVNWWGAANSEKGFFYFTGNGRDRDPGNDAPTIQQADGTIKPRPAWKTIKEAAAS